MEGFNGNENTLIQNEKCGMFVDAKCEDVVMEKLSSQRKNNGGFIIGMSYVNHFSMWMRMQKWHLMHLQCPEHKNYLDKWQKDRFKSKSKTWSKWTKTIT